MIDLIKELLENNKEVKEALQGRSDDFLLENQSIILTALDKDHIPEGYKVSISVNEDDIIEWSYEPTTEETKEFQLVGMISSMYKYKLPGDWGNLYKADLNDVNWLEYKRPLAAQTKRVVDQVENGDKNVKGFWVKGDSGKGKTFVMIALLNKMASLGKTVSFVDLTELSSTMKNTFGSFEDSSVSYVNKINRSDVVVLTGMDTKRPTDWVKNDILLPILSYRSKANKLTIFSSTIGINKFYSKLTAKDGGVLNKSPNSDEIDLAIEKTIMADIKSLIAEEINI